MKRSALFNLLVTLALALALLSVGRPARADTYTVTTTDDSGAGSLRQAIIDANGNPGPDTIEFSISGSGVHTITLSSVLPTLIDDGTTINGYSQSGASEATDTTSATLQIVIDGSSTIGYGLAIGSADNVIKGLVINNCTQSGITIDGSDATSNTISGNYIGVSASGTADQGNGWDGVRISGSAASNTVGGNTPAKRNIISGNNGDGISIGTQGNTISGNYIGTDASGTVTIGNDDDGIYVGGVDNIIGGATPGERNIISGNSHDGVDIGASNNIVSGNYIGVNATGTGVTLGNGDAGIRIGDGAQENNIGGDTAGERNVISANNDEGVIVEGSGTMSNTVCGNYIGTDASGTIDTGNTYSGVSIWNGAQNNTIGGNASGERNLISGNGTGVAILGSGTTSNTICGNYIGTDASGTGALGNTSRGVSISDGAQNNTVGGNTPGERNLISGNENNGVAIEGSDTTGNIVSGNYIGPDVDGTVALYNYNNGVYIGDGAHDNTIGGDTPGERNIISGNNGNGVSIGAGTSSAYNNTVSGNYIGTDANGTSSLSNTQDGVQINDGAYNNTIGGDEVGERNVISGNGRHGVLVEGNGTMHNTISGNYIGSNVNGASNLGNSQYGVYIRDGAQYNTVGGNTPGKGNVISDSYYDGVFVYGSGTTGNTISANSIHDNGSQGIHLQNGGNTELAAPTIISATATGASGTGCAWCTIHIYSDEEDEGETWHAPSVNADASGNWTYSGAISGPYATVTNTDSDGNTSEFSAPKGVGEKHEVYLPLVLKN